MTRPRIESSTMVWRMVLVDAISIIGSHELPRGNIGAISVSPRRQLKDFARRTSWRRDSMKLSSIALLASAVVAAPAVAQSVRGAPAPAERGANPRPGATSSFNDLTPIQLEDQWTTALVKRDAATFERLLAPRFVYTENASVMTRGDVIRSVTGPDHVEWARNEGMKLHDFGDVHVITGVLHLRGRSKSGSFDRRDPLTATRQPKNRHRHRKSRPREPISKKRPRETMFRGRPPTWVCLPAPN